MTLKKKGPRRKKKRPARLPYGKGANQWYHAQKRAIERYGITLNRQDREEIIRKIHEREADFFEKQSNRVSVWCVNHKGKRLVTVYDKLRKTICTFLPEGILPHQINTNWSETLNPKKDL